MQVSIVSQFFLPCGGEGFTSMYHMLVSSKGDDFSQESSILCLCSEFLAGAWMVCQTSR